MSERKRVVERYFEGSRRGDHAQVLACPTDDVVWDLPGYRHVEGKAADVFTFRGNQIARVESYLVPLGQS